MAGSVNVYDYDTFSKNSILDYRKQRVIWRHSNGYARVVRLELSNTSSNILHALSKRPLSTTDIFLFNGTRATSSLSQNYSILENIKDGSAISSKYNSEIIRFKTPNSVIVFTNNQPDKQRLSADRWRVYSINKEGLTCK